jgi:hypothetical protein
LASDVASEERSRVAIEVAADLQRRVRTGRRRIARDEMHER